MSLYSTRPCSGETSEMVRSGQPARRPTPSVARMTALRMCAPPIRNKGLAQHRAIRSPDESFGSSHRLDMRERIRPPTLLADPIDRWRSGLDRSQLQLKNTVNTMVDQL